MGFVAIQSPNLFNFSSHGITDKYDRTRAMSSKSLLQAVEQSKPVSTTTNSGGGLERLQSPDEELLQKGGNDLSRFIAKEATVEEEYWTAAWLRAETHWEDKTNARFVDSFKRKFAEQEFNTLKRRHHESKSSCIVAVRKPDRNLQQSVLKTVVGTLDLNIHCLLPGETFPGEKGGASSFCNTDRNNDTQYGYIANLCVAISARRQGIASIMVPFAVQMAKVDGIQQVYVHVDRRNQPAMDLYEKIGFKVVDIAIPQLEKEQTYLLCLQL